MRTCDALYDMMHSTTGKPGRIHKVDWVASRMLLFSTSVLCLGVPETENPEWKRRCRQPISHVHKLWRCVHACTRLILNVCVCFLSCGLSVSYAHAALVLGYLSPGASLQLLLLAWLGGCWGVVAFGPATMCFFTLGAPAHRVGWST